MTASPQPECRNCGEPSCRSLRPPYTTETGDLRHLACGGKPVDWYAKLKAAEAERDAERASREEPCTHDDGSPVVCCECDSPILAGEGGYTTRDGASWHAHACGERRAVRERDEARAMLRESEWNFTNGEQDSAGNLFYNSACFFLRTADGARPRPGLPAGEGAWRDEMKRTTLAEWATAHGVTPEKVALYQQFNDELSVVLDERDEARADALAHAIEAGRMREALERHGKHARVCEVVTFAAGDIFGARHVCDCGLDAALAPAAPGDVSLRDAIGKALAEAFLGGLNADRSSGEPVPWGPVTHPILDRLLSSAPSPSPAARLRVDVLLACEKAVRARDAKRAARYSCCHHADGSEPYQHESHQDECPADNADEAAHAAARAALAACDKEETK